MPSSRHAARQGRRVVIAQRPPAAQAMDPRKLLYLATIFEQRSLTKAAKLLAVSQPALSKSMDRLESDLGVKLMHRNAQGIEPTPMGERIYAHARLIREEMSVARARLAPEHRGSGTVTLGVLPSLASSVIPRAVSQWKLRHPTVLLKVVEKVQVELLLGLLRGHFDLIVAHTEFYDVGLEGLKQRVLFRDRLCAFARAGHALFRLKSPTWSDLVKFPWICPMVGGPQRTVLEMLLTAACVPMPTQLIECGSMDFTRALVASSDHLALLPEHTVRSDVDAGRVRVVDISAPALNRDIASIFRENAPLTPMARELVADIQAVGAALARGHG